MDIHSVTLNFKDIVMTHDTDSGRQSGQGAPPHTPDHPLEPIPIMQRVLDNPFLLLFLGVVVPTVFYILWGIMEIVSIPLAK
ncbi:hypothetical protein CCP4SC76_6770025 [Gammaproteobacteria bacterium]